MKPDMFNIYIELSSGMSCVYKHCKTEEEVCNFLNSNFDIDSKTFKNLCKTGSFQSNQYKICYRRMVYDKETGSNK